jgi:ethanolamine utilization protein EutP (predicted NTPase)
MADILNHGQWNGFYNKIVELTSQYEPTNIDINNMCAMCAQHDHINWASAICKVDIIALNNKLTVMCLIDTGADSANYISERAAAWLIKAGAEPIIITPVTVCGAVHNKSMNDVCNSNCKVIDRMLDVHVTLCNITKSEYFDIQISAKVLTTTKQKIDLIIGFPTIKKYKLIGKLFPELVYDDMHEGSIEMRKLTDLSPTWSKVQASPNSGISKVRHGRNRQSLPTTGVEHLVVLHTQSGTPYPDEDVALRDATPPWEVVGTNWEKGDTKDEIMQLLQARVFGPPSLQANIMKLCNEYIDIFSTSVNDKPAFIPAMELNVDIAKWQTNKHAGPARRQSEALEAETRKQIDKMLELKVIRPCQNGALVT